MTAIAMPAPQRASTPRPKQPSAATASDLPSRRQNNRARPVDPLSDRATENLIRRTLCPQQSLSGDQQPSPIEDLLPPLSSRNDVDLQLYAFLAIILREFVQSWYSRITTDESFVQEVLHVIAHCSRALEQRFRKVDMHSLVLDELPDLLDRHVIAFRISHRSSVQDPLEIRPQDIYHSLSPLPALAPVPSPEDPSSLEHQQHNEALYRQLLVQGVLSILLPTEDLENPCLTALVEQIISELIVGNVVVNKAAQPWLLFEAICIIARVLQQKQTMSNDQPADIPGTKQRGWSVHGLFLWLMAWALLAMSSLRVCFATLLAASSLPTRMGRVSNQTVINHEADDDIVKDGPAGKADREPVPVLEYRLWPALANVMELGSRMPWLSGMLSLLKYGAINGPWRPAAVDGALDRILTYHIATLLDPTHLPSVLRTLRGVLFPNNAPGTPSLFPPSSDEALLALRRRAASALWNLLPKSVGRLYFGGRLRRAAVGRRDDAGRADQGQGHNDEEMVDEVEGLLMVLSDEYCNKHLVYGILELVLVRLMPELAEKGVVELMEERLG